MFVMKLVVPIMILAFILGWYLNVLNTNHPADITPIKNISMTKNYVDRKDWGGSRLPCMISFYYLDTHVREDVFNCQV